MIGGGLIAELTPEPLLDVESGLVPRQVFQVQSYMGFDKGVHLFPPMPLGSVDIEPNGIPLQSPIEMSETLQESFSVSLRQSHHPPSTQQRRHPPENVEPLAVLAGRGNAKPLSFLRPAYPQTRMQGEAGFVLKNNGLIRSQTPEFFLTLSGIPSPARLVPEGTNTRLASGNSLTDASNTGPGGPSALSQIAVSDERPEWDHPNAPDSGRTPKGTSPNPLPTAGEWKALIGRDAPASSWASATADPPHSPYGPRDLGFAASVPVPSRSSCGSDPPRSAATLLSSVQYRPLELSGPGPGAAHELLQDALQSRLASSW